MTAVTRWKVKHSEKQPGRWIAYGTYGGRVVKGSGVTFRKWDSAMDYVNSKIRWTRR